MYICLNELYLPGMLQSVNTEIDAEKLSARLEVLVMLPKKDIPFLFQCASDLCCFTSTTTIVSTILEINILNWCKYGHLAI